MGIKTFPPTNDILTKEYIEKILTTDAAAAKSPVPAGTTKEDSSVVVLTGDDGYIDSSFLNLDELGEDLSDKIGAISEETIDEIFDSIFNDE